MSVNDRYFVATSEKETEQAKAYIQDFLGKMTDLQITEWLFSEVVQAPRENGIRMSPYSYHVNDGHYLFKHADVLPLARAEMKKRMDRPRITSSMLCIDLDAEPNNTLIGALGTFTQLYGARLLEGPPEPNFQYADRYVAREWIEWYKVRNGVDELAAWRMAIVKEAERRKLDLEKYEGTVDIHGQIVFHLKLEHAVPKL